MVRPLDRSCPQKIKGLAGQYLSEREHAVNRCVAPLPGCRLPAGRAEGMRDTRRNVTSTEAEPDDEGGEESAEVPAPEPFASALTLTLAMATA
jgi:hypothetical protein